MNGRPCGARFSNLEVRSDRVYKSFGSHHVLAGIRFEVRRGEMIAIVGDQAAARQLDGGK